MKQHEQARWFGRWFYVVTSPKTDERRRLRLACLSTGEWVDAHPDQWVPWSDRFPWWYGLRTPTMVTSLLGLGALDRFVRGIES